MLENTQESKAPAARIRLMGMWENTDKRGNKYLSGNLNTNCRVTIFKNSFKQNEREPDYILYLSQRTQDERTGTGGAAAAATPSPAAATDAPPAPAQEDDIPF